MKKVLSLVMALAIMLSLVACGSNSTESVATTESIASNKEYNIGEEVSTDRVKFKLERVDFTTSLRRVSNSDSDYLMPDDGLDGPASPGNILLSLSYRVENISKETHQDYPVLNIDYNDGYKFNSDQFYRFLGSGLGWGQLGGRYVGHSIGMDGKPMDMSTLDLQPLTSGCEIRGYFDVPKELKENADAPLKLIVTLANNDGSTSDFIYNIRAN